MLVASLDTNKNASLAHVKRTTFKQCFWNHKKLSNQIKHINDMELSKEFWEIKKCNGIPKIIWKIIKITLTIQTESAAFYV